MRLVLRGPYSEGTLDTLRGLLTTDWEIRVWLPEEGPAAFAAAMAEADATIGMRWTAESPPAPVLRLLQLPGAGFDRIDFAAVPPQASVCNVHEHEAGVAEYVIGTMLAWELRLLSMDANLRKGDWRDSQQVPTGMHGELAGKTLGIIGYGRIGRETARRAKALGMKVRACTRSPDKVDEHLDRCSSMRQLGKLLGKSHYVLVACPLTAATTGLIGAEQIGAMRKDGVLINVSRGGLVDEAALYEACRRRRIGGAIIDAWYVYPKRPTETVQPSRFPFNKLDNVIMTPHASAWTTGLLPRRWRAIAANLDRLARGEPLENVLRAPGGPPPA